MSMSMSANKILIVGPPSGQISQLITKVSAIQNKHGPFKAMFISGDLFSPGKTEQESTGPDTAAQAAAEPEGESQESQSQEQKLMDGELKLPIPTYFTIGIQPLPHSIVSLIKRKAESSPSFTRDEAPLELLPNLFFLGKAGVKMVHGMRIAVIGGGWDTSQWTESLSISSPVDQVDEIDLSPFITNRSISKLLSHPSFTAPIQPSIPKPIPTFKKEPTSLAEARAQAQAQSSASASSNETPDLSKVPKRPPIDLLFTNSWPAGITLHEKEALLPHETSRMWGSPPLSQLLRASTPRYCFSLAPGSSRFDRNQIVGLDPVEGQDGEIRKNGLFYERTPYENSGISPNLSHSNKYSRFVCLAKFANPIKKRWFLALNLTPADGLIQSEIQKIENFTLSPFEVKNQIKRSKRDSEKGDAQEDQELDSGPNYRWSAGNAKKRMKRDGDNDGPPPPGYVCKVCQSTEHYIRLCPVKAERDAGKNSKGKGTGSNAGLTSGRGWVGQNLDSEGEKEEGDENEGKTIRIRNGPHALPQKPDVPLPDNEKRKKRDVLPVGPEDCWFCLSNPQCAKHLIVAIGNECYLALPKGQLPPSSDPLSPVPGGGHVLIIPLEHISSILLSSNPISLFSEIESWRSALRRTYSEYNAISVSWEIGKIARKGFRASHTQIQVVPIPSNLENGLVEAFLSSAKESGYKLAENQVEAKEIVCGKSRLKEEDLNGDGNENGNENGNGRTNYCRLDLNDQTLVLWLDEKENQKFSLQWPRRTLATYLSVPDRADWKVCERSEAVESAEKEAFKECFEEFEPEFD